MPYRKAVQENEKRFGLKAEEQLEYQRGEFEKLLNRYAKNAGAEAREAQAKAETDERLESLIREADGEKPAKKAEGIVELPQDARGGDVSRRKLRPDAGLREASPRGGYPVGQQKAHEYEALRGSFGRRLPFRLTSFSRGL